MKFIFRKNGKFIFRKNGTMALEVNGRIVLGWSPIGMITVRGVMSAPTSAEIGENRIALHYHQNNVTLSVSYRDNGGLRMEVLNIPDHIDGFTFGPYLCPEAVRFGDMVGAAWAMDGTVVCIQGLNTKTVGEIPFIFHNETGFPSPCTRVAGISCGKIVISCSAENMTRPKTFAGISNNFQDLSADIVEGDSGKITGAAIALIYAENTESLLNDIGQLEVEEGLPHPTINGEWAKTSLHTTDIYFIFDDGNQEEQKKIAERAGVHDIYYSDPFQSWGHFDINMDKYPGGREQFCEMSRNADEHGFHTGIHTLSNFIHTRDPYVTPVPHPDLLVYDCTSITMDISETDTAIPISNSANYAKPSTLNAVRIGDEIICYQRFDETSNQLAECQRGAFHTVPAKHSCGDVLSRLADHGYATLFPNIYLQRHIAEAIGNLVRDAKIRRISFDGIEGCFYTGRGEYAASEFVKTVFDLAGNELICDASNCSHYRWHAHSYFNHGEPWYDTDRKGGMYNHRIRSMESFRANLFPGMLGWYVLWNSDGYFEPTLPETLESILSRTIGFDAGLCLKIQISWNQQKTPGLLDIIRLWQDFKHSSVRIPEDLLKKMREKYSSWHLEKNAGKWILSQIEMEQHHLSRVENSIVTESGTTGYINRPDGYEQTTLISHCSCVVCDRSSPDADLPYIREPFHCRIRIGTPLDCGHLYKMAFYEGWFSTTKVLDFNNFTAASGDYLEYCGGLELLHFDKDYNLIEKITGTGKELNYDGSALCSYTMHYDTDGTPMQLIFTHIHTMEKHEFPIGM